MLASLLHVLIITLSRAKCYSQGCMRPDAIDKPEAVLFDMDGTLTVPTFDFPAVRLAMGLPEGAPILEHMATMTPEERQAAEAILHRFEDEVAEKAPLADRCDDLLGSLIRRGVGIALITRNRRESVLTFLKRNPLPIKVWITREDAPHKPDPTPLRLACERLGVAPERCWMVGDGQYDVEAGINAGMRTVWLRLGRVRPFAATPWLEVEDLCELYDVVTRIR